VVVAFRRHTLLPLDDCLYALQPTIPHLTRSSLHRCLKRHGISRLPQVEGEASPKRKFKAYPIGFFHVDIAEVQTRKASSISLSRSTAHPSSRSPSSSTRPIRRPRAPSWRPLSPPCLTGLRSCSPTMESSSPTCRRTDQVRPLGSATTLSIAPVVSTGSSIG